MLLNERHVIASEDNLSVHLIDSRVDSLLGPLFNQIVQILFKLPDVSLDVPQQRVSSHPVVSDFQVNWHHVIPGSLDEVRQLLVLLWIWRCPSRRILRLDYRCWDDSGLNQLLNVLPLWRIVNHFNFRMLINALESLRWTKTRWSRWDYWNCSLKLKWNWVVSINEVVDTYRHVGLSNKAAGNSQDIS